MPSVLVVDDVPDNVRLLSRELRSLGYDVLTAGGGEEALSVAAEQRPDLVLLDIMMPDLDGIDVCRRMTADPTLRAIPVILISALDREDDVVRGLDAGALDYVSKPFNDAILAARVRAALRIKLSHDRIVAMNRTLSTFHHTLSHELKAPVTAAREFVELVLENDRLTNDERRYLDLTRSACNQIAVCIDDLLDTARLETGKFTIEPVPTEAGLLQAMVDSMRPDAEMRKLELRFECPDDLPLLLIDARRIRQVLTNLLSNAFKFTPAGGLVTVEVCRDLATPDFVTVHVRDTGRGIPPAELDRIFERHAQIQETDSTRDGGLGLGLDICRDLVARHGGTISASSTLDHGTTMTLTLPIARQESETVPPIPA